jgi:hypothetical protein
LVGVGALVTMAFFFAYTQVKSNAQNFGFSCAISFCLVSAPTFLTNFMSSSRSSSTHGHVGTVLPTACAGQTAILPVATKAAQPRDPEPSDEHELRYRRHVWVVGLSLHRREWRCLEPVMSGWCAFTTPHPRGVRESCKFGLIPSCRSQMSGWWAFTTSLPTAMSGSWLCLGGAPSPYRLLR